MNYGFDVQEPYKTFLINGQKTIEGRLNKGKFADLQIGDTLQFDSGEEFIVENISHYQSFKEMIEILGKETIIPDAQDDEDARNVYYRFYTSEDENKYGVLAIQLKRIDEMKRVA